MSDTLGGLTLLRRKPLATGGAKSLGDCRDVRTVQ